MNHPTPTRISPHMAKLWKMLNILFTIRAFELKVTKVEACIKNCNEGANKYMPHYSDLKKSYQGSLETFKERIQEEEIEYNRLLNELSLLSMDKLDCGMPAVATEVRAKY